MSEAPALQASNALPQLFMVPINHAFNDAMSLKTLANTLFDKLATNAVIAADPNGTQDEFKVQVGGNLTYQVTKIHRGIQQFYKVKLVAGSLTAEV